MFAASDYNYPEFTKSVLSKDLAGKAFAAGPEPGAWAPDFEGRRLDGNKFRLRNLRAGSNLVLTFGSATCPMTAGSLPALNDLYQEYKGGGDVQFLFVYVREAHPGDRIPAHESLDEKTAAAGLLRDEENMQLPILVDDLRGSIHRKYGKFPNATYLIDKSGRVAFRALWTQPDVLEEALEQLQQAQRKRGVEHAVVLGGEDTSLPLSSAVLHSYRALKRGGRKAVLDFEHAMGLPGKMAVASSRILGPVAENPGKSALAVLMGAAVLAGGLYAGYALRKRRLAVRDPYQNYAILPSEEEPGSGYGVVGI